MSLITKAEECREKQVTKLLGFHSCKVIPSNGRKGESGYSENLPQSW